MQKNLSEMSLEELWHLFPVTLTEHKAYWANWYTKEAELLKDILPDSQVARICHIGSTAVTGIWAKPIIDILVETAEHSDLSLLKAPLESAGYLCMSESPERISFNKGYTENGFAEKVFHLHIRLEGDTDEIFFRDYLNTHPKTAKDYEQLKLSLWKKYEYNRDAYTNAKTGFIKKYTDLAKEQ